MALRGDAIAPIAGTSAGAFAFRYRGRLAVSIVAKATFAFNPDGPMRRVDPRPVHVVDGPATSQTIADGRPPADSAPFLGHTDVTFAGFGYSLKEPVSSLPVRLGIVRDGRPLLDKTAAIQHAGAFARAPATPFAAIPQGAPPRAPMFGATPLRSVHGVLEIPDAFDWSAFSAAPPDQRIEHLRGDEWILLGNLGRTHSTLRTQLPGASATAHVRFLSDTTKTTKVELSADAIHIEGEAGLCSVVWRAVYPVASEDQLGDLRVLVRVDCPVADSEREETGTVADFGQTVGLTAGPRDSGLPFVSSGAATVMLGAVEIDDERTGTHALTDEESSAAGSGRGGLPFDVPDDDDMPGTMTLSELDHLGVVAAPIAPFSIPEPQGPGSAPRSAPVPGAPWASEPTEDVAAADGRTFTVDLPSKAPSAPPKKLSSGGDPIVKIAPPAPPLEPEKKASPWAAPEPSSPPEQAPVVFVEPRPDVKADLYGGFAPKKGGRKSK